MPSQPSGVKSANTRHTPGVRRTSTRPGAGRAVEDRVDVLEAGQVAAYDDEVQVLLVLARVVEQRPPAGGEHLEVEPGAARGAACGRRAPG